MKKQWMMLACAGVLTLSSALSPLLSFEAMAAAYAMENGAYRMEDGTAIDGVFARGIDVSHWKGDIDWETVANNDVQFVMLGTTYKDGEDPKFRENAMAASNAGLKVGAYIYSHATSAEMASQEADFILNLIKDYPISYPVAFDVEENSTLGTLSPQELSNVINTFCRKIEDAGYYPLVYANDYWLSNKIDLSLLEYDVWVARYGVKHTFENAVMWQATNTGAIDGVSGHVDIDFQYTDFSSYLPANQWRTIGDKTYYYQDYVMQKNTWIDDGTGWFYIGDDAQAEKGWTKLDSHYYYLDDTTGRMATGWLKQNDVWYYLDASGIMQTGWQTIDGNRYYLNQDGIMQTGWFKDGNQDYYLSTSSGKMTVGWREIDNSWYYFDNSGVKQNGWVSIDTGTYYLNAQGQMQTGWQDINGSWYYLNGNGQMQTGWQNINETWYYLNENGVMQTGILQLNDQMYYLDPTSGAMAVNADLTLNGVNYHADENGICTEIVAEEAPAENAEGTRSAEGSNAAGHGSATSESQAPSGPGDLIQ